MKFETIFIYAGHSFYFHGGFMPLVIDATCVHVFYVRLVVARAPRMVKWVKETVHRPYP